jgi:hypothetical protein
MTVDLAWTAMRWPGMEHAIVSSGPDGLRVDSQVLLVSRQGRPYRVSYLLECDAWWRVTELAIQVAGAGLDRSLVLSADGDGHWLADHRQPLPSLGACVDVDIACTPLTNTLPIRRLGGLPGAVHDITVTYVNIPELDVSLVQQRYTCLERREGPGEAVYRYESGSFRADLPVDVDGFVLDYPDIWRRV